MSITKNELLDSYSSMKKNQKYFWHWKLTSNVIFWHFLIARHYSNSSNLVFSFDYSWFIAKKLSNFVSLPWKLHNRYCHRLWYILFLPGLSGQKLSVSMVLNCPSSPKYQFKPVQKNRQHALRAYCSNIYTVASGNLVLRIDTSVTPVTVDKIFGLVGRDHSVYKVPLCNLQMLRKILFLHS